MAKKFYITTTAPYVNADPHLGFALEIVQADVLARYHRLLGEDVVFGFGTDEHGLKVYRKALEKKLTPQKYCDQSVARWNDLKQTLNLSYSHFIRTTENRHLEAALEIWRRCLKNGDIYKKTYKGKYCVGCELEKTDSELEDGRCPVHPNLEIELIDEENYFFRFSKFQKPLLGFYEKNPNFIVPEGKFKEIKTFVKNGLQDFSISRLKSKMPWGVEVPGDSEQVMYVWFDALTFYISNLGWPKDEKTFKNFWPGIQVAGKDNLRQQAAIWQAMLMSAGLPNSKQIFIHGFMTKDGKKISKSLGNTIEPDKLVKKYGTDAVRYYLLAKIHPFEDSDFTYAKFEEAYNADLANGLGNLVSRVCALADGKVPEISDDPDTHPLRVDGSIYNWKKGWTDIDTFLPQFQFDRAISSIWKFIAEADKYINTNEPWKLTKIDKKKFNWVIYGLLDSIHQIAWQIYPFLPETSVKIAKILNIEKLLVKNPLNKDSWTNIKPGAETKSVAPLFPRL